MFYLHSLKKSKSYPFLLFTFHLNLTRKIICRSLTNVVLMWQICIFEEKKADFFCQIDEQWLTFFMLLSLLSPS